MPAGKLRATLATAAAVCMWLSAAQATTYTYTGLHGPADYWEFAQNWSPVAEPASNPANGDVVIFDRTISTARNVVNIWDNDRYVSEAQFIAHDSCTLHHNHYTLHLNNPAAGTPAAFTQNDAGTVTLNCDLMFDSDAEFGGTGTGTVTVNGRNIAVDLIYDHGLRAGTFGTAGLIKNGAYDLVLNNYASYAGPTTVNSGRLLFNADSAEPNPAWVKGEPATYYLPFAMAPVAVNSGGTLGGTGILRAPVTVNTGGTLAPGASAGTLSVDSVTLAAGSTTAMELGGTAAGSHDQLTVTGQASLGGTLDLTFTSGYTAAANARIPILEYGTLDPAAPAFDAVNTPALSGLPANYEVSVNYGTGRDGEVTLSVDPVHYYVGPTANNWWMTTTNWSEGVQPGLSASTGDVLVFDDVHSTGTSTNTHDRHHYVKEVRYDTSSSWNMHNAVWDIYLADPAGDYGLVTQNGTGPVTFNCDLRLDDDTIFGGSGTGAITVNGSETAQHVSYGPRSGVHGDGALIKTGTYTLTLNNVASYMGGTIINGGTLLFNAESAAPNPNWASEPETPWIPVTQGEVVVNDGASLGGNGILRAPVTVNSGGTLAPGSSVGTLAVDSVSLAAGSTTAIELGGTAAGASDLLVVAGQASLGGSLDLAITGGYSPALGDTCTILQYGSLDPTSDSFDAVSGGTGSGHPANYQWDIDYGTGANSEVTLTYEAMPWYYLGANPTQDYWVADTGVGNWNYPGEPGRVRSRGDVAIFDQSISARNSTNIHSMGPAYLKEMRVITDGTWHFYNNERDIAFENPVAGEEALLTKHGSGVVTYDCDLLLNSDTIFGGTGTGSVVVNGSIVAVHTTQGPRFGITGSGGLTKEGPYTLVLNRVASYEGPTVINGGTLLFNAESAEQNPDWVNGEPDTYYVPMQMAPVTVNPGGTLGGTGILRAPVTVAGGTFSPGASAGILTVASLGLESDATTLMELGGTTPGNGTGFHDQAVVNGMLGLGGTLMVELIDSFTPVMGDSFDIFSYGELDPQASSFDDLALPDLGDGLFWYINYGSGADSNVTLNVNIPEPTTMALLGVGCAALIRRRRRGH